MATPRTSTLRKSVPGTLFFPLAVDIINPGTGYQIGDLISIAATYYQAPATWRVTGVAEGGQVTSLYLLRQGRYASIPTGHPNRVRLTGNGILLDFNITWTSQKF